MSDHEMLVSFRIKTSNLPLIIELTAGTATFVEAKMANVTNTQGPPSVKIKAARVTQRVTKKKTTQRRTFRDSIPLQDKLLAEFQAHPEKTFNAGALHKKIKGYVKHSFYGYLSEMQKNGILTRVGKGSYILANAA